MLFKRSFNEINEIYIEWNELSILITDMLVMRSMHNSIAVAWLRIVNGEKIKPHEPLHVIISICNYSLLTVLLVFKIKLHRIYIFSRVKT